MVIVHIACIRDTQFGGVSNVVPQYLNNQKQLASIAFVNILDERIGTDCYQVTNPPKNKLLQSLDEPFNCPDLVVFHEIYIYKYLSIAQELKENGIPYIIVPHGCLTKQAQARKALKKKLANMLFFNKFVANAEKIQYLSVSEQERSIVQKQYFVCGNGMDIPACHKEYDNNDGIVITYIGRIEIKIKGLDLLLKAVYNVRDYLKAHNVVINIYGPENNGQRSDLEKKVIEDELDEIVHVNKEVSGDEKVSILLDSDVFIQTSRTEGMPMGIIEAMAYGLPCLVTIGTSLGDIIRENDAGWVADIDQASIEKCLVKAVEEKSTIPEKGTNARKYAIENFAWEKVTRDTLGFYKNVIKEVQN